MSKISILGPTSFDDVVFTTTEVLPLNPWESHDTYVTTNLAAPLIWIRGPDGIVNEPFATQSPVTWTDFNASNGLTGAPVSIDGKFLDFNPLPMSAAIRTDAEGANWFLNSPGFQSQARVGDTVTTEYLANNVSIYNTLWDSNSHPNLASLPPGWPLDWSMQLTNMTSNTGGSYFYRVWDGNTSGDVVFLDTQPLPSPSLSASAPVVSGRDYLFNGAATLQAESNLQYSPSGIDTTTTTIMSASTYTPYSGQIGTNTQGFRISEGSIALQFVYTQEFDPVLYPGETIQGDQALIAIGNTNLVIENGGNLVFNTGETNPSDVGRIVNIGTLTPDEQYYFVAVTEDLGGSIYRKTYYLNGVQVYTLDSAFRWQPGFNPQPITVGRYGMSIANAQNPLVSPWGQLIITNEALTPTQVTDLYATV